MNGRSADPSASNSRARLAMISTHGYVAARPPLGAADTGGQVVYVLELSKTLAQLGYEVDVWTRRFLDQPESEVVADGVRILRVRSGTSAFIPTECLYETLPEWSENALAAIARAGIRYDFINSHCTTPRRSRLVTTSRSARAPSGPSTATPISWWPRRLPRRICCATTTESSRTSSE
jgi:hypothetical protein